MTSMDYLKFLPLIAPFVAIIIWWYNRAQKKSDIKHDLEKNLHHLMNYRPGLNFDHEETYQKFLTLYTSILTQFRALKMHLESEEIKNLFKAFNQRLGGMMGSNLPQMKNFAERVLTKLTS